MTTQAAPRPVMLCILDGWGYREETVENAVAQADTPNFDRLWASCPHGLLQACGIDVGLPAGQIGNSEVGHMNIGAGRVVYQDLPMIDKAIADGELARNAPLNGFLGRLKDSGGACHLMGLCSPGGVHAHQDHMVALVRAVVAAGVPAVLHLFLDGRDVPPASAKDQVARFLADLQGVPGWTVGTVIGRYYAMDRDKRWERVQLAYDAMVEGRGSAVADDAAAAIQASYDAGKTDEFVLPVVVGGFAGMRDGDGLLMANFRTDRAREILQALLDPAFDGFQRTPRRFAAALGMVEYSDLLNGLMAAIFPPKELTKVLGEVAAAAGKTQLRIAETEKYPHVTFFFNGGVETPFAGEDRILVPSPKVATYDLQPEMSAPEVTRRVVEAIDSGRYDLIILNYANPDMVGHTGVLSAAIKAVESCDRGLGEIVAAIDRQGGALLVTADHGNCDMMRDPETGEPHTAHTLNPVPCILYNGPAEVKALRHGRLADLAPTLLQLMGVPQPAEMTGESLLGPAGARRAAE
ncbi:MAG TPA: 2,3-bisphosphoglycerate-independent phosphoglycerate mutase [Alphaproteobacteria bacterium]|nr:2,3-bisphosphoglycerate-independent phosphoglycerate mutase [Alphaproteobacteria bacterium]